MQTTTKRTTERRTVNFLADGTLCVAVVADTHSAPHPNAKSLLRELRPQAILHAGDIGHLAVLDDLAEIAPTLAVRGNIDERAVNLPDILSVDFLDRGDPRLRLTMLHIGQYGPKLRADAAAVGRAEGAALIVCGHSHVPFVGRDRGLAVLNPGSIGPRRFHLPIVFGVLRILDGQLTMHHVDCETGQAWRPPSAQESTHGTR